MNPNDLVILNQAKALEGMRQRLRSHMMKLTDRQKMIDKMEEMIARRDEIIARLENTIDILDRNLAIAKQDRPEGYDSELTRKCQELEKKKAVIASIQDTLLSLGLKITVVP